MILRGSREDHVRFLVRWLENLDTSLGHKGLDVHVLEFNERVHKPGTETVEVRMPRFLGGYVIGLFVCDGQKVELTYAVAWYKPMLERALARLRERFE